MLELKNIFKDINVLIGPVPHSLVNATACGVLWQATREMFLLLVPGVARYLVETGRSITVEPFPNVPEIEIACHLKMLPLAALTYQRGLLAFHAATVIKDEHAILLAGNSGSGKSTLLFELLKRGWSMQSDELSIVGVNKEKQPIVFPVSADVLLWENTINKVNIGASSLIKGDANRLVYTVHKNFDETPRLLKGIYNLSVQGKPNIELEEVKASTRFKAICHMLYNSHVADIQCDRFSHFFCVTTIAQTSFVSNLRRPRGVWSVEALADYVQIEKKAYI